MGILGFGQLRSHFFVVALFAFAPICFAQKPGEVATDSCSAIVAKQVPLDTYGLMLLHLEDVAYLEGELERDQAWTLQQYYETLSEHDVRGYRVDYNGALVGVILFRTHEDSYEILRVVVAPGFRRKGVGTHLLNEVLGYLDQFHRNRMDVIVSEYNEALQFLLSLQKFRAVQVIRSRDEGVSYYWMSYLIDRLGRRVLPTPQFNRIQASPDGVVRWGSLLDLPNPPHDSLSPE